jgi:hypothetical protein
VLVPYSKYQLVASPLAVILPLSFAELWVSADAGAVTTVGGPKVEKLRSAPRLVPESLVATSR